ncbi:putative Ig domain-containing protein [Larkinella punicea]|uniref:putative Ig domain-containing protein n=1 Tax=Larkinella punicea TaxID=2315727 RepID=UPI001E641046|nr:putative Ig domain-containing protein [Larkinella punicea]
MQFWNNPGLPGGGNFTAFCNNEPGSNSMSAPTLALSAGISQPVLQNTPSVSITVSGCEGGTVNWAGSNNTKGTGAAIPVSTAAVGTWVYSATCTVGSCVSPPGTASVVISAPTTTGSFDGFVYGVDCETFRGWAWNRDKVNTVISVDILDGATVIATLPAGDFRQDLLNAGKGNGKHAFSLAIPASLKDGRPHLLTARVAGSSFMLKNPPKALTCQGSGEPINLPPVAPTTTPLSATIGTAFSVTLPVFTDPENQSLTYSLSGLPSGLSFTVSNRQISGTAATGAAGTYTLTYAASDGTNATPTSVVLTVVAGSTTPPPVVTGNFEGYLSVVNCQEIRGWVWDRNKPNTPMLVEFFADGISIGTIEAKNYRQDLKDAQKGNGAHGYAFATPAQVKDNVNHQISAKVQNSTYVLKGSPINLTCAPSGGRLSAERGDNLQAVLLGNPVSDQVRVEIRGAEGQPLRVQLTDVNGRLLNERQVEKAAAVEQLTLPVLHPMPGLLFLQVQSGSRSVTLKVLTQ